MADKSHEQPQSYFSQPHRAQLIGAGTGSVTQLWPWSTLIWSIAVLLYRFPFVKRKPMSMWECNAFFAGIKIIALAVSALHLA